MKKKKKMSFYLKILFLEMKFSIYLNRRVFVMNGDSLGMSFQASEKVVYYVHKIRKFPEKILNICFPEVLKNFRDPKKEFESALYTGHGKQAIRHENISI